MLVALLPEARDARKGRAEPRLSTNSVWSGGLRLGIWAWCWL